MNNAMYVLVLLALVQTGTALDCYSCESCGKDAKHWAKVLACGGTLNENGTQGLCLKEVLANGKEQVTSRKCVIVGTGSSAHYECQANNRKILTCSLCGTDFCNSTSSAEPPFRVLLGIMVYLIGHFIWIA